MKVETLSEKDINAIGHAFGYYEYAQGEKGLVSAYSSRDAVVSYINGYVEMVLQALVAAIPIIRWATPSTLLSRATLK